MSETIILTPDTYLGSYVEVYFAGEHQKSCFEVRVEPKAFAEQTRGKLLLGVEDEGGLLDVNARELNDDEVEHKGKICKWVSGLVFVKLPSSIECPDCGEEAIKYNPGIDKIWCSYCGLDLAEAR